MIEDGIEMYETNEEDFYKNTFKRLLLAFREAANELATEFEKEKDIVPLFNFIRDQIESNIPSQEQLVIVLNNIQNIVVPWLLMSLTADKGRLYLKKMGNFSYSIDVVMEIFRLEDKNEWRGLVSRKLKNNPVKNLLLTTWVTKKRKQK